MELLASDPEQIQKDPFFKARMQSFLRSVDRTSTHPTTEHL